MQNKKDRYYFYETAKLDENQHYVSKLDLNIEQNVIEEPKQPMIRISTKVYNNKKEYIGIIVINYLAERMLYDFVNISQNSIGEIYLINSNGYWIAGGKENENWAFMYEDKKNISFKNKFPLECKEINEGKKLIKSENGIYIWEELKFEDSYHEKSDNYEEMKKYYLMAIDKGYKNSMYRLGKYYQEVEKNYGLDLANLLPTRINNLYDNGYGKSKDEFYVLLKDLLMTDINKDNYVAMPYRDCETDRKSVV